MFSKNRKVGATNRYISGMRNIALNSAFSIKDYESTGTKADRNVGTILNFTKTDGINDQTDFKSFRKWTGLPEATRLNKMKGKSNGPSGGKTGRQDKVLAEHRKMTMLEPLDTRNFKTLDTTNPASVMSHNT